MKERGEILLEALLFLPLLVSAGYLAVDYGLRSYTRAAIAQSLRAEIESVSIGNNLLDSYDKLRNRLEVENQSRVQLGLALVDQNAGVVASAGDIELSEQALVELSRERIVNPFVDRGVLIEAVTSSGIRYRQFRLLRKAGGEW